MGWFDSLLGGLSDGFNAVTNYLGFKEQQEVNDLNYLLQKNNLAYQKDLQKIMMAREDNAVQRRVKDLEAAGLSPTLAAGSAASAGPVIGTTAPQKLSNLQGYMALAQVGTMIANQQKARTEADIAKQQLKQSKLDTSYYEDRGLAPAEVNQDWKARLLNLLYPKLEDSLFGEDTKSGFFGEIIESLKNDLITKPKSGVSVDNSSGNIVSKKGYKITNSQAYVLKSKGLYREWLNAGFTDNVKKALGM